MLSGKFSWRTVPEIKCFLYRYVHKSYYDALGLTPKASQVDIKKAYYKMSMVYHPDKGAGNSARFQEISTAYEVLGNIKLRKLYDKGMLPTGAARYAETQERSKTEEPLSSYSNQKTQQSKQEKTRGHHYDNVNASHFDSDVHKKRGPFTGRTEQYDFDAWTKAHYSETFAKQYADHELRRARKEARIQAKVDKLKKFESVISVMFVFIVAMSLYNVMSLNRKAIPHTPLTKEK